MDDLRRELECSICLERFTKPKILPCLHTFCEHCIQQHVDTKIENGAIPCPLCTIKANVPRDGACGFKDNFFIAQVSDVIPEGSDISCEVCKLMGLTVTAVKMCIECRDYMCQECAGIHKRTKITFAHRVVSLSDVRNGQYFDEMRSCQKVCCPIHPDETLKIFCECCKIPICVLCKVLKHDQHEMLSLSDAVRRADSEMERLLKQCREFAKYSEELSRKSKEVLENIETDQLFLKNKLSRVFKQCRDDVKRLIDQKEQSALDKINAEVAQAKKQAEVALGEAEIIRLKVTGTLTYAEKVLKDAKDAEKLQQYGDVVNRLRTLDTMCDFGEKVNLHPLKLVIPDLSINVKTESEIIRICFNFRYPTGGYKPQKLARAYPTDRSSSKLNGKKINHSLSQGPPKTDLLASATPPEQKQSFGERLFPLISNMYPERAGKITGMLLELDNSKLLFMLESRDALKAKVEEAVAVLQAHRARDY